MATGATMRAVVARDGACRVERVPSPKPGPDEVVVEVHLAAVCRTDVRVACGELGPGPRIPGHELVGVVGGCRVTVDPVFSEGVQLGVQVDGAFAERVCVPRSALVPVPDGLPDDRAVLAEPVAAALASAPALAGCRRIAVAGSNRIATLTRRVLVAAGLDVVAITVDDPGEGWDAVVETGLGPGDLDRLLGAVRPGGLVVLKSQLGHRPGLDVGAVVRRGLRLVGCRHGSFELALALLGELELDDLRGPVATLDEAPALLRHHHPARKPLIRVR